MRLILILLTIMTITGCADPSAPCRVEPIAQAGIFSHSINNPTFSYHGDTLTIHSGAKSDFFNAPNGIEKACNAPILFIEIDNTRPFTFSANVSPAFSETYDAGTLYLYKDDNNWQKFAFEIDERGITRLVTVRTIGTSDDNNHSAISASNVFMKISSDTESIGFYYSEDGKVWNLARLYKNDFPPKIFLGLSSQSPLGEGINTHFTAIELQNSAISNFRLGE